MQMPDPPPPITHFLTMVDEGLLFSLIIWLEIFQLWPCLARSENIRRRRYYLFCHMRQEVVQSDMRFYNACLMCCAVDTRNKSLLTDAIDVSCSAPHIHAIATLYKRAHCRVKLHGWQFIFMHTVKFLVIGGVNDFGTFGPCEMKSLVDTSRVPRLCPGLGAL